MKILMLTVDFVPHCDGVSTFSYQYALGLARAGHTVHVVAPRAKGCASSDAAEPFTTTRFPGYSLGVCRGVPFCLAAIWRILTFRPDLILPINIAYGGML
ncbi:MAG: glycosyltransferase, partial [Verrucomicrobia bacterium]|nr:glycosyltransferase [Verrucomicrobiota bacterium]